MKTFEADGKFNFVDDNNVFVGYDAYQCCCENADWFISNKEENRVDVVPFNGDIKSYVFDVNYFEEVGGIDLDGGGMVRFRLINPAGEELFLHLYNCHNGYYSHGFKATIGGLDWQEGSL